MSTTLDADDLRNMQLTAERADGPKVYALRGEALEISPAHSAHVRFFADARMIVLRLAAEVRRLREDLARYEQATAAAQAMADARTSEALDLTGENMRLRQHLRALLALVPPEHPAAVEARRVVEGGDRG